MTWTVFVFGCFANYCAEIYWLETFRNHEVCGDTLPMIHAEIEGHGITVRNIKCIRDANR